MAFHSAKVMFLPQTKLHRGTNNGVPSPPIMAPKTAQDDIFHSRTLALMNKAKSFGRSKLKPIQQSVKDWIVSLDIPNDSTEFMMNISTEIDDVVLLI